MQNTNIVDEDEAALLLRDMLGEIEQTQPDLMEFYETICGGEVHELERLLKCEAEINTEERYTLLHTKDSKKRTPLHYAVLFGSLDMVIELLELGVDIDAKDLNGATPLYYAVLFGRLSIVIELIKRGADPNAKSDVTGLALLHIAARQGNLGILIELLERGVDPNTKDNLDFTPLHDAAFYGRIKIVLELIKYGSDPNEKSKLGNKPSDLARDINTKRLLEKLEAIQEEYDSICDKYESRIGLTIFVLGLSVVTALTGCSCETAFTIEDGFSIIDDKQIASLACIIVGVLVLVISTPALFVTKHQFGSKREILIQSAKTELSEVSTESEFKETNSIPKLY